MQNQVVLFKHTVSIRGFSFEAGEMYVFEIGTILQHKIIRHQNHCLMGLDSFQNQYIETHCADWIDDKDKEDQKILAA